MDIIKLGDEKDAREKRVKQIIRKYEQETSDLKFLCSQFTHRIEDEQRRADFERKRVEDALGKQGIIGIGSRNYVV